MSGKKLGIVRIKVNAALLESLPGASINIGGVTRKAVTGGNRMLGYTEEITPAEVECEVAMGVGTSLVEMGKWADVQLNFECDTGQVYTVRDAFVVEPPKATAGEGKATLKFSGQPADEMGA